MGKLKEWSRIFDVADNAELFGARLYENNNKNDGVLYEMKEEEGERKRSKEKRRNTHGETGNGAYEECVNFREKIERNIVENILMQERFEREEAKNDVFYGIDEREIGEKRAYDLNEEQEEGLSEKIAEFAQRGEAEKIVRREEDFSGEGIAKVKRGQREKILNTVTQKYAEALGNVKIEVTNNNTIEKESDIDEISYRLTQKLCEMMTRGADGLY